MDDILITGRSNKVIEEAMKTLQSKFVMKIMGTPKIFLGITISKNHGTYKLSMQDTIERLEKNYKVEVTQRKLLNPIAKGFQTEEKSPFVVGERYSTVSGK